jgi:hypothetical protein
MEAPDAAAPAADPVPLLGISLAALHEFCAVHAGQLVPPAEGEAEDAARRGAPTPAPLPFDELTTGQVMYRLVKPVTASAACSYNEMLALGGALGPDGAPRVGRATLFVSHAWSGRFADLIDAVTAYYDAAPGAPDAAGAYVWQGERACACSGGKTAPTYPTITSNGTHTRSSSLAAAQTFSRSTSTACGTRTSRG